MTRPDFVQFCLETIDSEWDEDTFWPKPTLIDRRDGSREDGGPRSRSAELTDNNVVGIGTQPVAQNTPVGTGFDYAIDDAVQMRVEGLHADEHGHVDGASGFGTLCGEVLRCLHTEREYPTDDPLITDLQVAEVNDQSSDHQDYFRIDYRVEFNGFEELP